MAKICFYCDTIFTFGGVQRVLAVLAKALSVSHEITILTLEKPESEDRSMYELNQSNVRFRYLDMPPISSKEYLPCKLYSYLYKKKVLPQTPFTSRCYGYSSFPSSQQKKLIHELNAKEYDVIIGVHAFLSLRLATVRNRLHARRVIGWMHNSFQAFFENTPSYLEGLKSHFSHQMRRLDDVVVLAQSDANLYQQQLRLYPLVIYNPLTLVPQGRSTPQAHKFLAVGRFSARHKGFDILITAFARFATQNRQWTLDIVGEGLEEEMLRGLIASHGLEKRVTIHPFTKTIQAHYATASVYVLSSRWEGFGLVLIEAMAHGLPVIASRLPVVQELFGDKNNVLTFENGNADDLAEKLAQMALRTDWEEMQAESLATAQEFHIDTTLRRWQELLEK